MSTLKKSTNKPSITILPQSEGKMVAFQYSGYITKKEYLATLPAAMDATIEKYGRMNVLCSFAEDYEGWEEEAAQVNMKDVLNRAAFVDKIAYVNPPSSKVFQTKLLGSKIFNGEIKYFNAGDMDKALSWLSE